jgi:hypothetical protein
MQYKHLCLIYGIIPSLCSSAMNLMPRKMVQPLRDHPIAKVQFPNDAKMGDYADLIQVRESLVGNVSGFMDSFSFTAEFTDKIIEKNVYYCGYYCNTMVSNVFVYCPNEKVLFAAITFPGSWADDSLRAHFLHQMKRRMGAYKICVDQGFPQSGGMYETFVGPLKKGQHPSNSAKKCAL